MALRASSFFKGFDRYAQSVNLKYKKAGSFKTSCGGIATIISFLILLSWIIVDFFDVYVGESFDTTISQSYTPFENGAYPLYHITQNELFIMYKLRDLSGALGDDLDQYVTGLWVQYTIKDGIE